MKITAKPVSENSTVLNDNFVLFKNGKDIDNVMLLINVPEGAQSLSATDINNEKSA